MTNTVTTLTAQPDPGAAPIMCNGRPYRESISPADIARRVKEMGAAVVEDIERRGIPADQVVVAGVLTGAFIFMADLVRAMDPAWPTKMITIKSYHQGRSNGRVELIAGPDRAAIAGRHVILVEDIVDTGISMEWLMRHFTETLGAAGLTVVTLLHKPDATVRPVQLDHVGFIVPHVFVVGYGLDDPDGCGRGFPGILEAVSA